MMPGYTHLLFMLAADSATPAASATLTVSPMHLAEPAVCLDGYTAWKGAVLTSTAGCSPAIVEGTDKCKGKVALTLAGCNLANGPITVTNGGNSVKVVIDPKIAACEYMLGTKDGKLVRSSATSSMPGPFTGHIYRMDIDGKVKHVSVMTGVGADAGELRAGKELFVSTTPGQPLCKDDRSLTAVADDTPELPEPEKIDDFCRMSRARKIDTWRLQRETICVWTDGNKYVEVYRSDKLLPGKPVRLVLRGPSRLTFKARRAGTLGYAPELDVTAGAAEPARGTPAATTTAPGTTQTWHFEGRAPGDASIVIEDDANNPKATIEVDHPKTYAGSVRVGFAIVGGGAIDKQYESIKWPGSSTFEIAETSGGRFAYELVLAYSVYPESTIGGRDYRQHLFSRNNWGIGPVAGLGVVSASNGKVDLLKSLYLGVEFEPVRYFSISAGPVLRRLEALRDGFHVGSALSDTVIPLRSQIGVGWFVMINFAPQFMKTAFPAK